MAPPIDFFDFDFDCGNGESAALRHRIAGIERKIHDDLIDVARVREDGRELRSEFQVDHDMFADDSLEHADGLFHDFGVRERATQEDLLAAVSEELSGECSSLLRGTDDLAQGAAKFLIEWLPAELHRCVAEDDGG